VDRRRLFFSRSNSVDHLCEQLESGRVGHRIRPQNLLDRRRTRRRRNHVDHCRSSVQKICHRIAQRLHQGESSLPSSILNMSSSSLKIWNSSNGQSLQVLPSVEDAEITGMVFSDKGLIAVGWSRKIVKYPDIISEVSHERTAVTFASMLFRSLNLGQNR
jgi:hypothetical protein